MNFIDLLSDLIHEVHPWLQATEIMMRLTPLFVSVVFTVVQRVDSVSEGIANYGGKIVAVETDLKKLGEFHLYGLDLNICSSGG